MAEFRLKLPDQAVLLRLFRYDENTGHLWWLEKAKKRRLDRPAGTVMQTGYVAVSYNYKSYQAHRIIWKMLFDAEPEHLDHINTHRSDNRIINLRVTNKSLNGLNAKSKEFRLLPKGVVIDKKNYAAKVRLNGVNIHLGNFDNITEAALVYEKAVKEHFAKHGKL